MDKIKLILKRIIPVPILNFITGFFYGWRGNYKTWSEAQKKTSGYASPNILEKVKQATLKVKNGNAVFERDSVIFNKIEYSYPVLSALMWIAAQNKGKLNILDFGGSLGSSYYQNKQFSDSLPELNWCIVEQTNFVQEGLQNFSDEKLHFYYTIDECLSKNNIDIILLSSVLQYIEKPYELLEQIKSKRIKYILIDRTPFIKGKDRITIQKVHPKIYKAKYPCWFFNESKFINSIINDYNIIMEFDALDRANIQSTFKGFLFNKK
jgi:putative methyltransferase (TIGR04325 family)